MLVRTHRLTPMSLDPSLAIRIARSRTMAAVPSRRTSLEQLLAKEMWALGVRGWRRTYRIAETSPDFAFPGKRVAVFVDGCFWHACPECDKFPATNVEYWGTKLARNAERDREQTESLMADSWEVVRFWGHEVEASAAQCAARVANRLRVASALEV